MKRPHVSCVGVTAVVVAIVSLASAAALVGTFAWNFPWIVLAAGFVATLLASIATHALTSRRDYARQMVKDRTAELTAAVAELIETRSSLERLVTRGPTLVVRRDLRNPAAGYVSPNVARLFGHDLDAARKEEFFLDHAHPDDRPTLLAAITEIAAGHVTETTIGARLQDGAGRYRWVSVQLLADHTREGRVESVIAYIVDVNDLHIANEAALEAQQLAEAANQAKTTFLSQVSHELRTPLNAILGFGQLLTFDPLSSDQQEAVGHIVGAGKHLLQLVDGLLDVSTLEARELRFVLETFDIDELVLECVALMAPIAVAKDVTFVALAAPTGGATRLVRGDRQRVRQVTLNLLSNAIKYNDPRGRVTVGVNPINSQRTVVMVADNGCGIPDRDLSRIFLPFERVETMVGVEGIGIGLAIAQQLARAMDGEITVSSVPDEGSVFLFELPAANRLARGARPARLQQPTPGN